MRKLQPWERLVGSVRTVAAEGIRPVLYATGLAAAVIMARRAGETDLSFREVLTRHCELDESSEEALISLVEQRRDWLLSEFVAGL
jgi:hypothetical protein